MVKPFSVNVQGLTINRWHKVHLGAQHGRSGRELANTGKVSGNGSGQHYSFTTGFRHRTEELQREKARVDDVFEKVLLP